MTDREKEAFWKLANSLPSTRELLRQHHEASMRAAMNDPTKMQQPGEHPIDWEIRRFLTNEKSQLKRSHVGTLVKCPSCGKEVSDTDGRCKKCNATIYPQPVRAWWEGDVELGTTVCSCCDERLATKMCRVRIVKVTSCIGGAISYYEKYIQIPTCSRCYMKAKIPFIGKKTLDKNILLHFLFEHCGCGLDEYTSPLPLG